MPPATRPTDRILLGLAAASLVAGLTAHVLGHAESANVIWIAGAVPVLLALMLSVGRALVRGNLGVDVVAVLAIGAAIWLGEALTASVIALMLGSGRVLEGVAEARAQREMTALLSCAPRRATRFENGQWCDVELDSVLVGDRLLVRHGDAVPVDGSLAGPAQLNEASITGESAPRRRQAGERICSGVLNADAPFEMIATARARDSTFAGIVKMVRCAQAQRSPATRLADRYALAFVGATLLLAGAGWIASGDATRALAVLVVATPCPLILAVPVAVVSGLARCARRGVLVKSGAALERLAVARALFFDKTGTLTSGGARLVSIDCDNGWQSEEVLRLAASLAQASNHVMSEAVAMAARARNLPLSVPSLVNESAGAGVAGVVEGHVVSIGSYAYVSSGAAAMPWAQAILRRTASDGASAVFVAVDGALAGAIELADRIRLEAPRALRLLRRAGIERLVMLTGDRRDVAETIAAMLGVTEVHAEQAPADKLAAIEAARRDDVVVMVGDGVNDAPALAAADVGVAMGARGAAASSEAADVVLLVDRLDRLVEALHTARRARRIAIESVTAGMGLSIAAMLAALAGYVTPIAGAVLQELIDVAVIVNALRALRPGAGGAAAGTLAGADAARMHGEHLRLDPLIARIAALADGLPRLSGREAAAQLTSLSQALDAELVPHERRDDAEVYPQLSRLLGGDDPMAAMSAMHREIFRLTRLLARMTADLPPGGPDPVIVCELQRLLYGLDAIVRLHCAQEDELFHTLGDEPAL